MGELFHVADGGLPMLSLGMEITTAHGHSIDNLYLDGNGHLVVAELQRGKSPKDVTAQVADYGAYARRLDRAQIDAICQKRHRTGLDETYRTDLGQRLEPFANICGHSRPVSESLVALDSENPPINPKQTPVTIPAL